MGTYFDPKCIPKGARSITKLAAAATLGQEHSLSAIDETMRQKTRIVVTTQRGTGIARGCSAFPTSSET